MANLICAAFLSIASFLIFLKQKTNTGKASYFVFTAGFALLTVSFATTARNIPFLSGMTLLFADFGWILLDTYGCLEWSRQR